jgi:tripartite-type tricarboxylate transporter receptor subunit TctC
LPKPVLARISAEAIRAVHEPDVKKVFESDGATAVGSSSSEFALVLRAEIDKWTKVAKAANIRLE